MAIYECLRGVTCHPTAEELFNLVRPRTEKLSLATVYNTLDALSDAGLVRRMPTANGCCRYDADTSPHLHVTFRDTSEIVDVPADLSDRLVEGIPQDVVRAIGERLGVEIDGLSVQLTACRAPRTAEG